MEFQVASDIHLEFYKDKERGLPYLEITAPYLILAGDIGNPFKKNYSIYLAWASQNYKQVLLLSGNHEYYSPTKKRSMKEVDEKILEVSSNFPNVTDLNSADWRKDGLLIIGRTLWSDFSHSSEDLKRMIKMTMNDYLNIHLKDRTIEPDDLTRLHQEQLSCLKESLDRFEGDTTVKKVIVVSHHAPSRLMLHPDYKGDLLGTAYANQLDELITSHSKIAAWISGHTHHSHKTTLGSTILLSNCLGYRLPDGGLQSTGYDPRRIVEVILS